MYTNDVKRFVVLVPHRDALGEVKKAHPDEPLAIVLEEVGAALEYRELREMARGLREESLADGGWFERELYGMKIRFRQAAVANMAARETEAGCEWKIGKLIWLPHGMNIVRN
jgi:hypothetical protein